MSEYYLIFSIGKKLYPQRASPHTSMYNSSQVSPNVSYSVVGQHLAAMLLAQADGHCPFIRTLTETASRNVVANTHGLKQSKQI